MPDRSSLTGSQRELLEKVAKGTHSASDPVELCALHALARLGHLDVTHDADGFHFTAKKKAQANRSRSKKPAKG